MNGRKARERRRAAMIQTTTPRDPEAPRPPRFEQHPLGETAGAYVQWEARMKAGLLSIMEENRKALGACTQDESCPSSVHYPSCLAAQ